MIGRPAVSARVLVRGFALLSGILVLIGVASCGRETFDLLPMGGGAGVLGLAGATDRGGAGGGGGGTGGSDRDAGTSKAGGGNGNGGSSGSGAGGGPQGGGEDACLPGESCTDGGVRCPPTVAFCKRCQSPSDCGHDAPAFCDVADGHCVECLPGKGNCKPGENCDPTFLRCAKACQNSGDCDDPNHRYCDPSRGVCVDCTNNAQCNVVAGKENYLCAAGFCVECLNDARCSPAKPLCQQFRCVAKP